MAQEETERARSCTKRRTDAAARRTRQSQLPFRAQICFFLCHLFPPLSHLSRTHHLINSTVLPVYLPPTTLAIIIRHIIARNVLGQYVADLSREQLRREFVVQRAH